MAQGKNAYIRYKVLDRCFRDSRRHYYMEDLVEACNEELYNYDGSSVSERTIREDIHFMQRQAGVVCLWREKWMGIEPIIHILIENFPFRIFQ